MDLRVQGLEEREAGWKAEWKTANDRLTAAITAMAYNIQVIGAKLVPLDDLHQWKPQVDAAMEEIRGDVGDLRKQVERVIQPTVDDHTPQKPAPPTRLPEDDALGPDGHRRRMMRSAQMGPESVH